MNTVLFGDTINAVITALNAALTVPVTSKVPNPRPASFVTVFRTGGPRLNLVTDGAQVTIDTWGTTGPATADLAQQVRQALHNFAGTVVTGIPIYTVTELSGPGVLPDPSEQDRYRQSFIVATRGN